MVILNRNVIHQHVGTQAKMYISNAKKKKIYNFMEYIFLGTCAIFVI